MKRKMRLMFIGLAVFLTTLMCKGIISAIYSNELEIDKDNREILESSQASSFGMQDGKTTGKLYKAGMQMYMSSDKPFSFKEKDFFYNDKDFEKNKFYTNVIGFVKKISKIDQVTVKGKVKTKKSYYIAYITLPTDLVINDPSKSKIFKIKSKGGVFYNVLTTQAALDKQYEPKSLDVRILLDINGIVTIIGLIFAIVMGAINIFDGFLLPKTWNGIVRLWHRLINYKFYKKYKGTNWTPNEVRNLNILSINGDRLIINSKNDYQYEIALRRSELDGKVTYLHFINKDLQYAGGRMDFSTIDNNAIRGYYNRTMDNSIEVSDDVKDILSVFKNTSYQYGGGVCNIVLPSGWQYILSAEDKSIIIESFKNSKYEFTFTDTYISVRLPRNSFTPHNQVR